jgi:hypothetical protein
MFVNVNKRVEEYRRKAVECERQALRAPTEPVRHAYWDLALHWRNLARQAADLAEKRELNGPRLP